MRKSLSLLIVLLFVVSGCAKKSVGWEMVIHAKKAQLESTRLTLIGVSENATLFTKQTPRKVRSAFLKYIVRDWDVLFESSKPNAVLTMADSNGKVTDNVVILQKPSLVGDRLEFLIENQTKNGILEGFQATLFIDASSEPDERDFSMANLHLGNS